MELSYYLNSNDNSIVVEHVYKVDGNVLAFTSVFRATPVDPIPTNFVPITADEALKYSLEMKSVWQTNLGMDAKTIAEIEASATKGIIGGAVKKARKARKV